MRRHIPGFGVMEAYLLEYQHICALWALRKFLFLCFSSGTTFLLVYLLRDWESALYTSKCIFFGLLLVFNFFSLLGHFQIWLKEDQSQ